MNQDLDVFFTKCVMVFYSTLWSKNEKDSKFLFQILFFIFNLSSAISENLL